MYIQYPQERTIPRGRLSFKKVGKWCDRGSLNSSENFQPFRYGSNNYYLMTMRTQKIGSIQSSEHSNPSRLISPGLLTRKPDKKAPFARKKGIQCAHPQNKFGPRLSREKLSPQLSSQPGNASLKIIGTYLTEDIKYLSPKHAQSSLQMTTSDKSLPIHRMNSEIHPKNTSYEASQFTFLPFEDMATSDFTHTPSGISIQSITGKSYAVETAEHSGDWFGLEGENERLKEENKKLETEISKLREELEQQPFSKKCQKCTHFDSLERQKKEKSEQEQRLNIYKNQIKKLKQTIIQLQIDLKQERKTVNLLSRELDAARQAEQQMDALVCTLKEKIQSDSLELRYLNIQQDVLKRKKDEFQRNRIEVVRKDLERDSMRRVLNQYKQKVDQLLKMISKGMREKKAHDMVQDEISLELSMETIL